MKTNVNSNFHFIRLNLKSLIFLIFALLLCILSPFQFLFLNKQINSEKFCFFLQINESKVSIICF